MLQLLGALWFRYRANLAHVRQPRPDFGLGVRVKVLHTLKVAPSSLGSAVGAAIRLTRTLFPGEEKSNSEKLTGMYEELRVST